MICKVIKVPTSIFAIILNMVKVIFDVHQKFLTGNHAPQQGDPHY